MHLGSASYERAIGLLHGVASIVSLRRSSVTTDTHDEFRADDGSDLLARISAVRRDPDVDEREAVLELEPLIAEALAKLLTPYEA